LVLLICPSCSILKTRKHDVSETGSVSAHSSEGKDTPTLLGPLEKVHVSLHSPEDGNRSSFLNDVFSSYLEFPTTDKVHEPNYSGRYITSSEPFRFYIRFYYTCIRVGSVILYTLVISCIFNYSEMS
jgi:hypothetical protein